MNRLCAQSICVCKGGFQTPQDWPVLNISSEDPDALIFAATIYTPTDYHPPCLGPSCTPAQIYSVQDCYGVTFSTESQEVANLLAKVIAATDCSTPAVDEVCATDCTNDTQIATIRCDGEGLNFSTFWYIARAGLFVSPILNCGDGAACKAAANALALAFAQQQVSALYVCLRKPSMRGLNDWACLNKQFQPGDQVYDLSGSQSQSNYTYSVVSGSLPPGLTLEQTEHNSAELTGTPTAVGKFTFTIRATRTDLAHVYAEVEDTLEIFGISNAGDLTDAKVDHAYSYQLAGGVATPPASYEFNPGKPAPGWMTIDANSGLLGGTPTDISSKYDFGVIIRDGNGHACPYDCSIKVTGPKFLNAPVDGAECTAYGPLQILTSPTPCTFSGGCPGSLVISAGGIISGIPHVRGAETFVLTAVDADGNTNTQTTTVNFTSSGGFVTAVGEMVWTGEFTVPTGTCNFSAYHVGGRIIYDIDFPVAVRSMLISTISFPRSNLRRCIGEPGYDIRIVSVWTVGANVNGSITTNQVDVAGQFIYSSPSGPPAIGGAQDVTLPAAGWPAAGGQTDFQFAIQNGPALGPWDIFHAHYEITITPAYPP